MEPKYIGVIRNPLTQPPPPLVHMDIDKGTDTDIDMDIGIDIDQNLTNCAVINSNYCRHACVSVSGNYDVSQAWT